VRAASSQHLAAASLSGDRAVELAHVQCSRHQTAEIAVLTDGIERLVLNYAIKSVHRPFFDRNIQAIRQWGGVAKSTSLSLALASYLSSPEVSERTDDDLTLVLASRLRPGEGKLDRLLGDMSAE
jgi:hypothetical protein